MPNRSVLSERHLFAMLGALFLAAACLPVAQAQTDKLAPEKRAQIEAAVSKVMAAKHIPGVSVAVVENGSSSGPPASAWPIWKISCRPHPAHCTGLPRSRSRLTAVAAMQLYERGKLDLDAPVQKYCPAFPQKDTPISTRQVMGHLGGIRHYRQDPEKDLEIGNTKHFDNPIEAGLNFFKDDPLVAKPGTEFHYSTQGYTLVGCVVEGASGKKYVDYMREQVFMPAECRAPNPTNVSRSFRTAPASTISTNPATSRER